MEGGTLVPGTVHLTNNLYALHNIFRIRNWLLDNAFDEHNDIFASYSGPEDPNYADLGFANILGTTPEDFDLMSADSPAVDTGADIPGNTLDYFNRARPNGNAPDIGAMEFSSGQVVCIPRFPIDSGQPSLRHIRPNRPSYVPIRPAVRRREPDDFRQRWIIKR